ncbi:hypothetical protein POTOM_049505 [Populus tomentosa]|uniref:Uncharacterized protein n=1 Tax=Populus tomentosa TaxID=118781 RepID=A0A8X8CAG6_POPTO|nr:hypothetical protein POTOM_049505 [Populus tomentosa]
MPISLSLPAGVIAFGYRNYSPPLKRLLAHNNNDIALFRYLYLRSSCNHIPSQLTSLFCFKFFPTNLNCLLTGNSLFFRMEILDERLASNHYKGKSVSSWVDILCSSRLH